MPHATGRPTVGIVGGGWAGLACAFMLAKAGYAPVVFEAAPEPGGRARRALIEGAYRDNGQHLMLGGCTTLAQLFAEISIALPNSPFAYTDGTRRLALSSHGQHLGKVNLLLGLLGRNPFKWHERIALLRALWQLQRQQWQVPANQTVAQWLHTQGQPARLIEHFWAPLALAILNTPLDNAAMARLAPVLRDTLGKGTGALTLLQPPADLTRSIVSPWVNAIRAHGGEVHCGQRVSAIQLNRNDCYTLQLPHGQAVSCDLVVLSVPPWALAHITLPFDTQALTQRFGAQPIATVYLGFDAHVQLPTPLVLLAGPTQSDTRVWASDRRHCGEPGVIAVSLSAEGAWVELDSQTLVARCLASLKSAGITDPCRWQRVVTTQKATYSASPGAALTEAEHAPRPGLWLCGDWTDPHYPATLEAAVRSGIATARKMMTNQSLENESTDQFLVKI